MNRLILSNEMELALMYLPDSRPKDGLLARPDSLTEDGFDIGPEGFTFHMFMRFDIFGILYS